MGLDIETYRQRGTMFLRKKISIFQKSLEQWKTGGGDPVETARVIKMYSDEIAKIESVLAEKEA